MKKFDVLFAQSILTRITVEAEDADAAQNKAWELYVEPTPELGADSILSDAYEIIDYDEVKS